MEFINKENILAAISVLAFIMSLSTWVFTFINQRRKVKLNVEHYYQSGNGNYHFFLFSIENRSRLPILITHIYLINENQNKLKCQIMPTEVITTTLKSGNVEKTLKSIYSIQFPISISSLDGISGYIAFEDRQKVIPVLTTDANFEVHTNRGRSFLLKLPLNKIVDVQYFLPR